MQVAFVGCFACVRPTKHLLMRGGPLGFVDIILTVWIEALSRQPHLAQGGWIGNSFP